MTGIAEIEKTVLDLPVDQRAALAESLLASLSAADEESSVEAEIAEAERREREIATGLVRPLSQDELLKRVQSVRRR